MRPKTRSKAGFRPSLKGLQGNRTKYSTSGKDHNVVCDITGFVFKRSECVINWKGQLVWSGQYEPKHPQLSLKPVTDDISINDARPQVSEFLTSPVDPDDLHPLRGGHG